MHKTIRWTAAIVLALASPALYALGLGSAKVNSFLNQPLDVRVELTSQSSEELQSVTAGLASAKDFEFLGLKLNSISVPLDFEVVTEGNKSYIHITSNLNASNPIMQVLVEVVWSNGRMLREYTLFLDPPAFASKAPAPQVSKSAAALVAPPPPVAVQTPPQQIPAGQSAPTAPVVSAGTATPPADISTGSPAESSADDLTGSSVDSSADSVPETRGTDATSRVGKGQTLWGIASDWSMGTGYSVNQAMIAIQHKNPDAFIDDNINLLKQGEILRMPASDEMAAITSQQAALEVRRQAGSLLSPGLKMPDYATPTVADSGDYQETYPDDVSASDKDFSEGRLEIVPPSDADNDAIGAISQTADEVTADNVEGQVLQEKLTRAEEDLINAELENSYLKDRITELEREAEVAKSVQVQDATLANMEQAMADKQASDEPEPPVALTPGGEQQPWYAGATIWLLAAVLFLILLVVWFLRRKSRLDSERLQEIESRSAVQAATDDAEDLLDLLDNYSAGPSTRKSLDYEGRKAGGAEDQNADQSQDEAESEDPDADTVVEPLMAVVVNEEESDPEDAELSPEPAIRLPDESATDPGDFDFGSDTDTGMDEDEVETQPSADTPSDDDYVEGDTVIAGSEEVNDPELKLDLARAYLSLGDKEAARSMLDEVLVNGNEDQVAEAEQMLDEL